MLLADQERSHWRNDEIAEALDLVVHPALARPISQSAASYALQARIAVEHASTPSSAATRWDWIVGQYDLLLELMPSPSARLARAIAFGPAAGLAALDGVEIPGSHRVAAVRAALLARDGELRGAAAAYDEAIAACRNDTERAHLLERRQTLQE